MCCSFVCFGYNLLIVSILACGLSFVAPFWLLYPDTSISNVFNTGQIGNALKGTFSAGLFATCTGSSSSVSCQWFWQDNFSWEKQLPDWHKASQGLFAAGLVFLVVSLAIGTFHVCCCCCKQSFSIGSTLGSLTCFGMLLIAASLGVYGAYQAKENNVNFNETNIKFYWGFFAGIFGVAVALVAVILFFCAGCRNRDHSGYHMTRVV